MDGIEFINSEKDEHYIQTSSGIEDYNEYTLATPKNWQKAFKKVLNWARVTPLNDDQGISEGFIGDLQKKPEGCNGIPLVGFARRKKTGGAMSNGWFARLPLKWSAVRPMTIILPLWLKQIDLPDNKIYRGQGANICPVDLEDFLTNPKKYIKID
jgi:hypothetical protein